MKSGQREEEFKQKQQPFGDSSNGQKEKSQMRIWDLYPAVLCNQHLLGEHRELHAIWVYLTTDKGGSYRKHPETLRWKNKLEALHHRHDLLVREMKKRGFAHYTPLMLRVHSKEIYQLQYLITPSQQIQLLRDKGCKCKV